LIPAPNLDCVEFRFPPPHRGISLILPTTDAFAGKLSSWQLFPAYQSVAFATPVFAVSHSITHGTSLISFDGFAPASQWQGRSAPVGGTRAAELTKVARSDGKDFICAAWMHKARSLPRDPFRREVDQHVAGKDTEPTEIIDSKFYRSQIPGIEQAIETAALMLGSDKSRGHCLQMIGADCRAYLQNRNFLSGLLVQGGHAGQRREVADYFARSRPWLAPLGL